MSTNQPVWSRALIYLAAAVSDFYIREEMLPTHKIQSGNGELQLTLSLVPKFLERLVSKVVPNAYVVSFKLETNDEILISKSKKALEKYGHQVVIGKLCSTLDQTKKNSIEPIEMSEEELHKGLEIEQRIVRNLKKTTKIYKNCREIDLTTFKNVVGSICLLYI
uniref:DNA/pantothenate metabolism flavoprotein C-terminal domain-containing protein n=1 Tax=Ditylenchus dipsaci TaxID=166011 RepID=A0A915ENV4_9BILA